MRAKPALRCAAAGMSEHSFYRSGLLQLISVNIPAFELAIAAAAAAAVAAPYTDYQGFGVWSLLIISV